MSSNAVSLVARAHAVDTARTPHARRTPASHDQDRRLTSQTGWADLLGRPQSTTAPATWPTSAASSRCWPWSAT